MVWYRPYSVGPNFGKHLRRTTCDFLKKVEDLILRDLSNSMVGSGGTYTHFKEDIPHLVSQVRRIFQLYPFLATA